LGASPAILWCSFSIIYFGSIFPNTYYAKTNVVDSQSAIYNQAKLYYLFTLFKDPGTHFIVLALFASAIYRRSKFALISALTIIPYLYYIFKVGGDFMGGRFFSYTTFLSAFLLLNLLPDCKRLKISLLSLAIAYLAIFPDTSIKYLKNSGPDFSLFNDYSGVVDEKKWYYHASGLIPNLNSSNLHNMIDVPISTFYGRKVIIYGQIGYLGFTLGRDYHIIDPLALTDALLARLPGAGRIGHKRRLIPEGYVDSVIYSENRISDARLKDYYNEILILTRNDLFNSERFKKIFEFHFSEKKKYHHAYRYNIKDIEEDEFIKTLSEEQLRQFINQVYFKGESPF
jgi:arabinofuranosyltransferase